MNNDFFNPEEDDFFNEGFDLNKNRNELSDYLNKLEEEKANKKSEFEGFEEGDGEYCEVYESVMKAALISKPFGIMWDEEYIIKFLKKLGYKIVERIDEDTNDIYPVPVKPGTEVIPEKRNELRRVFDMEIQKVLLKFLFKIIDE